MQILIAATAVSVAVLQPASQLVRATRSDPVLVRSVVDGDTIDVASMGRVRLLGIDAPELGRVFDTPAPFAREARDKLVSLIGNRWVRLEGEDSGFDVYRRRLAYVVREDGLFVNAAMVREGLARVTARMPLARLDELKRAEQDARAFRRGMWGAMPELSAGYTRSSKPKRTPSATRRKPRLRARP